MLLEGVAGRFYLVRENVSNEPGAEGSSYHSFLEVVCIEGTINKKNPEGVWAFKFGIKEEPVMEMKDQ